MRWQFEPLARCCPRLLQHWIWLLCVVAREICQVTHGAGKQQRHKHTQRRRHAKACWDTSRYHSAGPSGADCGWGGRRGCPARAVQYGGPGEGWRFSAGVRTLIDVRERRADLVAQQLALLALRQLWLARVCPPSTRRLRAQVVKHALQPIQLHKFRSVGVKDLLGGGVRRPGTPLILLLVERLLVPPVCDRRAAGGARQLGFCVGRRGGGARGRKREDEGTGRQDCDVRNTRPRGVAGSRRSAHWRGRSSRPTARGRACAQACWGGPERWSKLTANVVGLPSMVRLYREETQRSFKH